MQGFISYAHADHAMVATLRQQLRAIERAHKFSFWIDHEIDPGQVWNYEIQRSIAAADVFLLLISPAFSASNYVNNHEVPAILERRGTAGALVVPVLLLDCLHEYLVPALESVPTTEAKALLPIADWKPQRNGYTRAARQIAKMLERHYGPPSAIPLPVTPLGPTP